jgi:hypothetical protein
MCTSHVNCPSAPLPGLSPCSSVRISAGATRHTRQPRRLHFVLLFPPPLVSVLPAFFWCCATPCVCAPRIFRCCCDSPAVSLPPFLVVQSEFLPALCITTPALAFSGLGFTSLLLPHNTRNYNISCLHEYIRRIAPWLYSLSNEKDPLSPTHAVLSPCSLL